MQYKSRRMSFCCFLSKSIIRSTEPSWTQSSGFSSRLSSKNPVKSFSRSFSRINYPSSMSNPKFVSRRMDGVVSPERISSARSTINFLAFGFVFLMFLIDNLSTLWEFRPNLSIMTLLLMTKSLGRPSRISS